ncbi:MAG: FAD-dependent monooxygenase, partial [Duncaniella sp.]|nr:FAD-dependent monooxygenase [Duncaniella sp.]
MIEDITLTTDPRTASEERFLVALAARKLNVAPSRVKRVVIARRSIDARQRDVKINLALKVYVDELPEDVSLCNPEIYEKLPADAPQGIIVGAGPAGLFAALRLIQLGVRPVILERGKDVDARRKDMARIARDNIVDPDSNYCFGEGGAGAFSDGKLYTRSKKRGSIEKILNIFCQHGASEDILRDAHPHIGTDRLPEVIKAMRHTIEASGGEIRFGTRVERLIICDGCVKGVIDAAGNGYHGPVI